MNYKDFKLPCFSCDFGHSCKYYSSPLWVDYMVRNERECPALKYPYDSLYFSLLKLKKKREEENQYGIIQEYNKYEGTYKPYDPLSELK